MLKKISNFKDDFQIGGSKESVFINISNITFLEMVCTYLATNTSVIERFEKQKQGTLSVIDRFALLPIDQINRNLDRLQPLLNNLLQTFDASKMGVTQEFVNRLDQNNPLRATFAAHLKK